MRPTTSAVLLALAVTLAGPPARAASEPKVVTGFAHPESALIDGPMVVSDWRAIDPPIAGALLRLAPDGSVVGTLDVGLPIRGPADFAVDASKNEIWISATVDGAVVIAPLGR